MVHNAKLIFVERKQNFQVEAKKLLDNFKQNLLITSLKEIRILNKYIIANVSEDVYQKSLFSIFAEKVTDDLFENDFVKNDNDIVLAIELLPGQFDQRANSAIQCLKLIDPKSNPIVTCAKVYVFSGKLNKAQIDKIENFLINPVESKKVDYLSKDYKIDLKEPNEIEIISNFINWNDKELKFYYDNNRFAMNYNDLQFIQSYFKKENRDPTVTEIKIIDTYWSDHCRHTTFETKIIDSKISDNGLSKPIKYAYECYLKSRKNVYGEKVNDRKISLMDIATICAKEFKKQGLLNDLDLSDEINACSIKVDVEVEGKIEQYALMFKNETHNHPTEIEPFGGASTCLGGAIRDPLSGRTYVYQAMRITGSADPTVDISKTISGKLPQRKITTEATKGYSSYGNQIGLATGQVDELYHPNYVAKRLEVGAVIGCAPMENIYRAKPIEGDVIILLGGKTGRDGIGGATGSSRKHDTTSSIQCGAEVQKGNAIEERKIQRLFRRKEVTSLIKKCNDFGAGGVSVAIGELCDGLEINLDSIPKKYLSLDGTELAISESQERMAVVVSNIDAQKFIDFANDENIEATIVAKVTSDNRLKMFWNNKMICDISRDFLNTNGFTQSIEVEVEQPKKYPFSVSNKVDVKKKWKEITGDLNSCLKIGMVEQFDSTIGANTVLMPFGGKNQLTPAEGMAALLPTFIIDKTNLCSLMTYGFNPNIGMWSPFHMAHYAVIESITKIVAMGGDYKKIRLSFQEYFEKLKNSKSWGKPFSALLGAYLTQQEFKLAAIGGKDSMSGTYENINVPPTLISFAVATEDANNIISPEFKTNSSTIVLVKPNYKKDRTIDIDSLKKNFDVVSKAIKNKKIISAYSLKQNGVAEGLIKMSFGNSIGVDFSNLTKNELFEINYGSLILEITNGIDLKQTLVGSNYKVIGQTNNVSLIRNEQFKISFKIEELLEISRKKLENVFPTTIETKSSDNIEIKTFINQDKKYYHKKILQPLVVMPVFPGTNCEFDEQFAFEKFGAKVKQVLIKNLDSDLFLQSIKELVKWIKKANIIMIPGGFSAADEPDGSAKFIVNVFKNEKVKKATTKFLDKKNGLMLGICNGFQALIKLGLLPYGKIKDVNENSPTLTYNSIYKHMSGIVRTKLVSNKSPWFNELEIGKITNVAISHGEGKFIANEETVKMLEVNGQIAMQYVDLKNNPTMKMPFNPNGSTYAVEAITSYDGKILGKMGHSERIGPNLYKNVLGDYDQKIFESAVKYFTNGGKNKKEK